MSSKIVIGLDGSASGDRAVAYASDLAKQIGACELHLVYVIEWSPFTFQTAEENAERHKRREEEIDAAMTRVVTPTLKRLSDEGLSATGKVLHGDVADLIDKAAADMGANQIVVGRASDAGLKKRIFGTSTANLVMHASVPVTVVG